VVREDRGLRQRGAGGERQRERGHNRVTGAGDVRHIAGDRRDRAFRIDWFTPLALSPTSPSPRPPMGDAGLNSFGYATDPDGQKCPIGSHIRRSNPRDARTVQRNTNRSRRLVRRGIPYGPPYDPEHPKTAERGLLGSFMCANLSSQFEAIQYDWTNLGLLDPRITGSNDPILGNNDPLFSHFSFPVGKESVTFRGFPHFIHTRGGAYLFQPSISAIRHLALLGGGNAAGPTHGA